MAIQAINLGSAPTGAGGDTFRSTATKVNENFSNPAHAASRQVGLAEGNVMQVGAFGLGTLTPPTFPGDFANQKIAGSGLYYTPASTGLADGQMLYISRGFWLKGLHFPVGVSAPSLITATSSDASLSSFTMLVRGLNTTVDSNGFVKSASPVVQLFADKIEANVQAGELNPAFEKISIGHYLIKNTTGFSDDGWYIEMPKDANGNVLVAVQYQQLEDNTIEVKTFSKKFDEETGDIIPNLEKPRDIPSGRWIDIRLKELPKPEIDIPISTPPAEFQPTNLAQAVVEALKNGAEQ